MSIIYPEHQVVHHHYPRTSGSTLRHCLGECLEWPTSHASVATYVETLAGLDGRGHYEHFMAQTLPLYRWIAIVRNPYDVVLSLHQNLQVLPENHYWRNITLSDFLTEGFVKKKLGPLRFRGFEFLSQTDHLALPAGLRAPNDLKIVRFEDPDMWAQIWQFLGKPAPARPHIGVVAPRRPMAELYDRQAADIVTKVFEKDLEKFRYERFVP